MKPTKKKKYKNQNFLQKIMNYKKKKKKKEQIKKQRVINLQL